MCRLEVKAINIINFSCMELPIRIQEYMTVSFKNGFLASGTCEVLTLGNPVL